MKLAESLDRGELCKGILLSKKNLSKVGKWRLENMSVLLYRAVRLRIHGVNFTSSMQIKAGYKINCFRRT